MDVKNHWHKKVIYEKINFDKNEYCWISILKYLTMKKKDKAVKDILSIDKESSNEQRVKSKLSTLLDITIN